jgi:hypothetical protein
VLAENAHPFESSVQGPRHAVVSVPANRMRKASYVQSVLFPCATQYRCSMLDCQAVPAEHSHPSDDQMKRPKYSRRVSARTFCSSGRCDFEARMGSLVTSPHRCHSLTAARFTQEQHTQVCGPLWGTPPGVLDRNARTCGKWDASVQRPTPACRQSPLPGDWVRHAPVLAIDSSPYLIV